MKKSFLIIFLIPLLGLVGCIKQKNCMRFNMKPLIVFFAIVISVLSLHAQTEQTHTGTFDNIFVNVNRCDIKTSILQIYDSNEMIVLSTQLTGSIGHYSWDIRNIASGFYTFTIMSDGKKLNTGKVIIQK